MCCREICSVNTLQGLPSTVERYADRILEWSLTKSWIVFFQDVGIRRLFCVSILQRLSQRQNLVKAIQATMMFVGLWPQQSQDECEKEQGDYLGHDVQYTTS